MKRYREPTQVFCVVLGLLLSSAIVGLGFWERQHPCEKYKYRTSTCGGDMYCMSYDQSFNCLIWSTSPTYGCKVSECVKRK